MAAYHDRHVEDTLASVCASNRLKTWCSSTASGSCCIPNAAVDVCHRIVGGTDTLLTSLALVMRSCVRKRALQSLGYEHGITSPMDRSSVVV